MPFLVLAACCLIFSFVDAVSAGADPAPAAEPTDFEVPCNRPWISTGITLTAKQKLLIEEVEGAEQVLVNGNKKHAVSARGTYLFDVKPGPYPLEPDRLLDDRRYPIYCLYGRIGENGIPFYVGSKFKGVAPQSGELWLGINDPAPSRNRGAFRCRISLNYPDPPEPKPAFTELETRAEGKTNPDAPEPPPVEAKPLAPPKAVADANVVIIYIDGLRPDVVEEMAQWGHMPHFNELFIQNGTWVRNSFTVQPSLTMTSFSSMITGVYANRHGVKMQAYYDRDAEKYINALDPRYFERLAEEVKARGVKAIYDYFPESFGSGAMPFEPLRSNVLNINLSEWLHRALDAADYASNIESKMDEAQTRFAVDMASSPKVRVMLVWLPGNDVVSEHTPHGQFGGARPTIARMDQDLGQIVERLKNRHRFEKTYFILTSDHGHSGGHDIINKRYDIKREVFHAYLKMSVMGIWHRFAYPDAPAVRLGAVSDTDGAVGIFLPLEHVDSGEYSRPNTYEELSHYGLADGSEVNAVELFTEFNLKGRWPHDDLPHRPVDFAVTKVDEDTVLLYKSMERQALIHTRRNSDGAYEYNYEPVSRFVMGEAPQAILSGDPLGYLDSADFREEVGDLTLWMDSYHTGTEWLQATYQTEYPGCVDTIALYFRWDGPVTEKSPQPSQPGILLFASKGWVFEAKINLDNRLENTIGSRHGMAFRESTNNCLFVSGPGIRKDTIIETPHRIVDIMPTVLEMMGEDASLAGMDGSPILEIWEGYP